VIDRLGKATLALFETATNDKLDSQPPPVQGNFGEVTLDYLDSFDRPQDSEPLPADEPDHELDFSENMDLDALLDFGFDMSLPLLTDVFNANDSLEA
jgi:hypothetical protein